MDGIRQHKEMAMTGKVSEGGSSFGVAPFHEVNGGRATTTGDRRHQTEYGEQSRMLGDGERGVGRHVERGKGMMPAQRHPDHGPHDHHETKGAFGVESFRSMNG